MTHRNLKIIMKNIIFLQSITQELKLPAVPIKGDRESACYCSSDAARRVTCTGVFSDGTTVFSNRRGYCEFSSLFSCLKVNAYGFRDRKQLTLYQEYQTALILHLVTISLLIQSHCQRGCASFSGPRQNPDGR